MKNQVIFDVWKNSKKEHRNKDISVFLMKSFGLVDTDSVPRVLQIYVSSLNCKISARWERSVRDMKRFQNDNEKWLNEEIQLPDEFYNQVPTSSSKPNRGRPSKLFDECAPKVQKRKIHELVSTRTPSEIAVAAEVSLRSAGKRDAANLIKELVLSSPARATNLKKARLTQHEPNKIISPEEALLLMVNTKLSTFQYKNMRQQLKTMNANVYPAYYLVQEAKKECYPEEEAFNVTDVSAEVRLQALLDITVKRIIKAQNDISEHLTSLGSNVLSLRLISKWGCDGSSAQSRYKISIDDAESSDENLFSVTFVPLRLVDDISRRVLWQNPRPNSTRYCRLVRFIFKKENKKLINIEQHQMQDQINRLMPTNLVLNDTQMECKHELLFTMVDGKVCSALSQYDSSQKCYICGATPKEMNSERSVIKKPDEKMFNFGISPLHSWIRAFECLLHISYKLEIKKWQARSQEEKNLVANRKKFMQSRFREQLGLLVDMPKQIAGNTNDGNTARKFFRNAEISAEITGLNIDLIKRFRILLEVISSDYEIDADKFGTYANETKNLYLRHYAWYHMPASIHKLLMHSKDIIQACILPLGQLSEEAQEASNKEYRRFREHFSRKSSRINSNRDVLNRFLLSSDPYLSSRSTMLHRKRNPLPLESISLLKAPDEELLDIGSSDEEEFESD